MKDDEGQLLYLKDVDSETKKINKAFATLESLAIYSSNKHKKPRSLFKELQSSPSFKLLPSQGILGFRYEKKHFKCFSCIEPDVENNVPNIGKPKLQIEDETASSSVNLLKNVNSIEQKIRPDALEEINRYNTSVDQINIHKKKKCNFCEVSESSGPFHDHVGDKNEIQLNEDAACKTDDK